MATANIGIVSPVVKGTYSSEATYDRLNIVHGTDGATYQAIQAVPAGTALSNTEYWMQLTPKAPTIGTVTDVAYDAGASVTNSGTAMAPVYDFEIPRGVTGNESIDDTKGDGDTDYVWSADKSYNEVTDLKSAIISKQDRLTAISDNLYNYSSENIVTGKYIDSTGAEHSGSNYQISDYIPIIGGEKYTIQYTDVANSSVKNCWYGFDKNIISTFTMADGTITAPDDACYLRVSELITNPELNVRRGDTGGDYSYYEESEIVPFIKSVDNKYSYLVGQLLQYTKLEENVTVASATTNYPLLTSGLKMYTKYICFCNPSGLTGSVFVGPKQNTSNRQKFDSMNNNLEISTEKNGDLYLSSSTGGTYSGNIYIFEVTNEYLETYLLSINYTEMIQMLGRLCAGKVPVKTSQLINDSGFVGNTDIPKIITSRNGIPELSQKSSSVNANTTITINDFPRYLNKDFTIVFTGLITDSFTSLKIGNGYQSYRGRWIEIDNTNVVIKTYESAEETISTTAHGLTISSYISVIYTVGNNGNVTIAINTLGGTYQKTESSFVHNGTLFASVGQAMSNVILKGVATGLKKPMWLIGDSYFGFQTTRVMGNLRNLGYTKGVCVSGLAGLSATNAYPDLLRMLELATPKYLVWAIGMNTNDFVTSLPNVVSICENLDIELILYLCPSTPVNDRSSIRTAVIATGLRYVDAMQAVGASSDGSTWYTGYLSEDNVHPTSEGAMALTIRYLVDVPEIAEFVDND